MQSLYLLYQGAPYAIPHLQGVIWCNTKSSQCHLAQQQIIRASTGCTTIFSEGNDTHMNLQDSLRNWVKGLSFDYICSRSQYCFHQ